MSLYTTKIKEICEHYSGGKISDFEDVEDVINNSVDSIFVDPPTFVNPEYDRDLFKKILLHYYMREICCTPVGLWKLRLKSKLYDISPYYSQLYESARIKYDPFNDTNITTIRSGVLTKTKSVNTNEGNTNVKTNVESHKKNLAGEDTKDTTSNQDTNESKLNSNTTQNVFSDTPSGTLSDIDNETYLTNATIEKNNKLNSGTQNINSSVHGSNTYNETEQNNRTNNYTENENKNKEEKANESNTNSDSETIVGKRNNKSLSEAMIEYRKSLINVDEQIIKELSVLFFGLWG